MREFFSDITFSLKAWRRAPYLPLAAPVFILISNLLFQGDEPPAFMAVLALPLVILAIFFIGWLGTERMVYVAAWRGQTLGFRELTKLTSRYIGRFFLLGIITAPITVIPYLVLSASGGDVSDPGGYVFVFAALFFINGVLLTFVTPALVFSTPLAIGAFRFGWNTMKRTWPRCAPYLLVAPLLPAYLAFVSIDRSSYDDPLILTVNVFNAVVLVLFKGATAAFYLRANEIALEDVPPEWDRDPAAEEPEPAPGG